MKPIRQRYPRVMRVLQLNISKELDTQLAILEAEGYYHPPVQTFGLIPYSCHPSTWRQCQWDLEHYESMKHVHSYDCWAD